MSFSATSRPALFRRAIGIGGKTGGSGGNPLAIYDRHFTTGPTRDHLHLKEHMIYGSQRLGVERPTGAAAEYAVNFTSFLGPNGNGETVYTDPVYGPLPSTLDTRPTARALGNKRYELSNHLGNVLSVVSDRRMGVQDADPLAVHHYRADVRSYSDFDPFGALLPNRFAFEPDGYRFGFQGQEKDDELHNATGTSLAFEYRMHDPRVGRFLSIDPLSAKYPWNSPYAFSENRVIDAIELEGAESLIINEYRNDNTGETRIQKIRWDQMPGAEGTEGPLGPGTVVNSQLIHGNFNSTANTYTEVKDGETFSFDLSDLFSGMGGVWGQGAGGEMRKHGKGGLAWDAKWFMMVVSKMRKTDAGIKGLKDDVYKSGRPGDFLSKKGSDRGGYTKDLADGDQPRAADEESGEASDTITLDIRFDTTITDGNTRTTMGGYRTIRTTPKDTVGKNYKLF